MGVVMIIKAYSSYSRPTKRENKKRKWLQQVLQVHTDIIDTTDLQANTHSSFIQ